MKKVLAFLLAAMLLMGCALADAALLSSGDAPQLEEEEMPLAQPDGLAVIDKLADEGSVATALIVDDDQIDARANEPYVIRYHFDIETDTAPGKMSLAWYKTQNWRSNTTLVWASSGFYVTCTTSKPGYYTVIVRCKMDDGTVLEDSVLVHVANADGSEVELPDFEVFPDYPVAGVAGETWKPTFWYMGGIQPIRWQNSVSLDGEDIWNQTSTQPITLQAGEYVYQGTVTDARGEVREFSVAFTVSAPAPLKGGQYVLDCIDGHSVYAHFTYEGGQHAVTNTQYLYYNDPEAGWTVEWEADGSLPASYRFATQHDGAYELRVKLTDGVDTVWLSTGEFTVGVPPTYQTLLSLPLETTVIGEGAFAGDASFEMVQCPAELAAIQSRAFAQCAGLKRIYIPATATEIAADAFEGVTGLTVVTDSKDSPAARLARSLGYLVEVGGSVK